MASPPPSPTTPPRATVTKVNGEVTCSVAETNRVRALLGLRPLRPERPAAAKQAAEKAKQAPSAAGSSLEERLRKARAKREARQRAVAARSLGDDPSDEEGDEDQYSKLRGWVARARATENEAPRARSVTENRQVAPHRDGPALPKGDDVEDGAVLVLADAPVLPERNGNGGEDARDRLRDVHEMDRRRKDEYDAMEINGLAYDGTKVDAVAEDGKEGGMGAGGESLEKGEGLRVESAYRSRKDVEAAFVKRGKRTRKKRRRVREAGETVEQIRVADDGHVAELRRQADVKRETDGGSSEEDAMYLRQARLRRAEREKEKKSTVDAILETIDRANQDGGEDALQEAEDVLHAEMQQFLQKLPAAAEESDSDSEPEMARRVVTHVDDGDRMTDASAEGNGAMHVDSGTGAGTGTARAPGEENNNGRVAGLSKGGNSGGPPLPPVTPAPDSVAAQTGVAAVLQRLRARGELSKRAEQVGRARDERFSSEEDGGMDRVKLEYLDEFGQALTRKEAFRALCHRFHGKGPGQNKREKRMRHMLEQARSRNMGDGDTPLKSAAALVVETRSSGQAHVVLQGPGVVVGKRVTEAPAEQVKEEKKDEVTEKMEKRVSFSFGIENAAKRRRR